jgi:hypothetical protein
MVPDGYGGGLGGESGVQVIVESGVGNGGSTRAACAWARAVPGRPVGPAWNGLGTGILCL